MSTFGEKPSLPLRVFYSYSHKDRKWLERLRNHLANLERLNRIVTFFDRQILPGDDWDRRIRDEVEEADVFLCLISEYFLASSYCNEQEMKRALQRHEKREAIVIPIAVGDCDWKDTPFAQLQAIPDPDFPIASSSRPSRELKKVARHLHMVTDQVLSGEFVHPFRSDVQAVPVASRTRVPWLLPHLCNRWRQEQALFDAFDLARTNPLRPHVLILHGPREEVLDGFVERLQWDLLPRIFNRLDTQVRRLPPLDWPLLFRKRSDAVSMFSPLLAKCIDCPRSFDMSKMAAMLSPVEGITLLTATVDSHAWIQSQAVAFMRFLEFWDRWPSLPLHRHLVITLLVKLDISSNRRSDGKTNLALANKRIAAILRNLEPDDYSGLNLCVLPVLQPVSQLEAEAFVSRREVQTFCSPESSLDMLAEVGALYRRKGHFAMEQLLPQLTALLQRFAR